MAFNANIKDGTTCDIGFAQHQMRLRIYQWNLKPGIKKGA
jgi:hypothetical protein